MKTIIAGSRYTQMPIDKVYQAIHNCGWCVSEIVSGHGGNVDHAAEYAASTLNVPLTTFKPNWTVGRKAGPLRNAQMAAYADALIAIWDGKSKGTLSMIKEAKKNQLLLYIVLDKYKEITYGK